jgi:hypothetical protein
MKHVGEPVRLMSGEYGTVIVEDGDEYPEWFEAKEAEGVAEEAEPDEESD